MECLWLKRCYMRAKFIVTAPSRISSMNLRSRLIVNLGCVWIGSVTVKRKPEVSVIGFLFWLLILQEMHLSIWLAARILISPCYPVITTFSCDLITFLFSVWLLERLNIFSTWVWTWHQYKRFLNKIKPQDLCLMFRAEPCDRILFVFVLWNL